MTTQSAQISNSKVIFQIKNEIVADQATYLELL
jgi:hypothetical protein